MRDISRVAGTNLFLHQRTADEGKVVEGYNETRTRAVDIVGADCSPAGTKGAGTGSHRLWIAEACVRVSLTKPHWSLKSLHKYLARPGGLPKRRHSSSMGASQRLIAEGEEDGSHAHVRSVRCALAESVSRNYTNLQYR